jgi:hypothetical protein
MSLLMMRALSKLVVAHRWYVLMEILDSNTRCRWMSARSPCGSPEGFLDCVIGPPHPLDD